MSDSSFWHSPGRKEPPVIDTSVAHVARIRNYWRGGKDNFATTPSTQWGGVGRKVQEGAAI